MCAASTVTCMHERLVGGLCLVETRVMEVMQACDMHMHVANKFP